MVTHIQASAGIFPCIPLSVHSQFIKSITKVCDSNSTVIIPQSLLFNTPPFCCVSIPVSHYCIHYMHQLKYISSQKKTWKWKSMASFIRHVLFAVLLWDNSSEERKKRGWGMRTMTEWKRSKKVTGKTVKDLPKHWRDAQNHFLHSNKALHRLNPVAAVSQHEGSERKGKQREKETLYSNKHYSACTI